MKNLPYNQHLNGLRRVKIAVEKNRLSVAYLPQSFYGLKRKCSLAELGSRIPCMAGRPLYSVALRLVGLSNDSGYLVWAWYINYLPYNQHLNSLRRVKIAVKCPVPPRHQLNALCIYGTSWTTSTGFKSAVKPQSHRLAYMLTGPISKQYGVRVTQ